jgi:sterol desaturase/sphingolipid hydroxylase (fatty acid hydroxylase superfamily)
MSIIYFLTWTFCLYWIHRVVHYIPVIREIHLDHHAFVNTHETKWHWSNLFLYNDTWTSTLDLWITEVVPTIIFSCITGQWWLCIFYYVWAAFLQEPFEHNKNVNIPLLTHGRWHLIHHKNVKKNFGLFFPLWDKLFGTEYIKI